MNEEKMRTEGSVFALVLGRFMEARGMSADLDSMVSVVERSGLDPKVFRARLAGDLQVKHPPLSGLADELGLSEPEKGALAVAYVFEKEYGEPTGAELTEPETAGKTVRELRKEHGLTREELAEGMRISERDLMKLESSGQRYRSLDREWFALVAEPYGYDKVFWYPPEKAVWEWERAIDLLKALGTLAEAVDSEPLVVAITDAIHGAREELDGCRDLLANFERQEEQIRSETVEVSSEVSEEA